VPQAYNDRTRPWLRRAATVMNQSSDRESAKQVSELFDELRASGKSSEDVFVTLYADLKQLARMKVARQPAGASMHATRFLSDLY
jgi:DNA-directed RNA polymerase specialized sigma24 family protein